jgi:sec-independent protein translocase protein TatB
MFDISWGKLVIIGVVALLVIGPKELPSVLRQLGQWMTKIRRMAAEFQGQFQEAMREAEMADLKKQFDETTSSIKSTFDTTEIKNELEKMIQDPVSASTPTSSTASTPPSDPTAPAPQTPASAPTDPVALGTAPVAPPAADLSVPMPELPPPPETKDFVDASAAPAAPASAPAPAPPAPSDPKPAATPEGGKAA